ncbi:homeobox protein 2, partial [Aplysia californica]|uniref:Homeobox protein 2 n=1 Tax=Aplysia californica TaxID=6500 RepID=A0ABM1VV73_APLCA
MSGAAPGLGGRGAGDPGSSYSSSSRPVSAPSYTSPDRAARLSPTTVGSVFPALENLQRISHGHASASSATAGGSGGGVSSSSAPSGRDGSAAPSRVTRSPSAAASSSYSAHQHPTAHHHHHHQTRSSTSTPRGGGGGGGGSGVLSAMSGGPAVISQPTLPTYRQASVEGPSGGFLSSHGGSFPPATAAPLHHRHSTSDIPPYSLESALPDILHSHILPQIPPPRQNQHRQQRDRTRASRNSGGNNNSSNNNNNNNRSGDSNNNSNSNNNESRDQQRRNNRHRSTHGGDRSHRHHRHRRRLRSQPSSSSASQGEGGMCKEPCVKCVVTVTSFRWVLVVLSVLGVCCVVTGIVLAALHAAGNSFLFLAIMFI